jgi:hypothetical protein
MICSQQEYSEIQVSNNKVLFTGTSCYPLSPLDQNAKKAGSEKNMVSSQDQLKVILEILGKQD